jgi:N-acetylglucosaminyl-diphospho-decaprenol L-rhamnosyltransferase
MPSLRRPGARSEEHEISSQRRDCSAPRDLADLAVVIVAFRCRDDVLASVGRVLETVLQHRLEVVVVDNDSRDGTTQALADRFGEVRVLPMGRNVGFGRANNAGIAATTARNVLFLNPDTLVEPTALDTMVAWLDGHQGAGVVAPRLLHADGTDQHTARAFPTPAAAVFGRRSPLTRLFPRNRWSRRFLVGRDHLGDEPFEIDWVSGACMLVPRAVIAEVGAFDPEFFLYWEDADWCRRIKHARYSVWCVPKALVVHDEGGTRGHEWPAPIVCHFHRGAYLYWRKHHAPQAWNPLRWAAAAVLACRAFVIILRNKQVNP